MLFNEIMKAQKDNTATAKRVNSKAKTAAKAGNRLKIDNEAFKKNMESVAKCYDRVLTGQSELSKALEQKEFFEDQNNPSVKVRLKNNISIDTLQKNITEESTYLSEALDDARPKAASLMVAKLKHLVGRRDIHKDELMPELLALESRLDEDVTVEEFQKLIEIRDVVAKSVEKDAPQLAEGLSSGETFYLNTTMMEALSDNNYTNLPEFEQAVAEEVVLEPKQEEALVQDAVAVENEKEEGRKVGSWKGVFANLKTKIVKGAEILQAKAKETYEDLMQEKFPRMKEAISQKFEDKGLIEEPALDENHEIVLDEAPKMDTPELKEREDFSFEKMLNGEVTKVYSPQPDNTEMSYTMQMDDDLLKARIGSENTKEFVEKNPDATKVSMDQFFEASKALIGRLHDANLDISKDVTQAMERREPTIDMNNLPEVDNGPSVDIDEPDLEHSFKIER